MIDIDAIVQSVFTESEVGDHVSIAKGETIDTTETSDFDFEDTLGGVVSSDPNYNIMDLSDNDNNYNFDGVAKEKIVKVNNEAYAVRITVRRLK